MPVVRKRRQNSIKIADADIRAHGAGDLLVNAAGPGVQVSGAIWMDGLDTVIGAARAGAGFDGPRQELLFFEAIDTIKSAGTVVIDAQGGIQTVQVNPATESRRFILPAAQIIVLNALANLLLKYATVQRGGAPAASGAGIPGLLQTYLSVPFVAGLCCFALNVLIYTQALKKLPLSLAYPLMVSLGYLIIVVVSAFWFGERLSATRYLGIGLMLTGLWFAVR